MLWLGSVAWPAGMGGLPTIHDDLRSDHSGVVPAKGAFSFFPFVLSGACCFLLCSSLAAGLASRGSWQRLAGYASSSVSRSGACMAAGICRGLFPWCSLALGISYINESSSVC